jgi:hypothetical protein
MLRRGALSDHEAEFYKKSPKPNVEANRRD